MTVVRLRPLQDARSSCYSDPPLGAPLCSTSTEPWIISGLDGINPVPHRPHCKSLDMRTLHSLIRPTHEECLGIMICSETEISSTDIVRLLARLHNRGIDSQGSRTLSYSQSYITNIHRLSPSIYLSPSDLLSIQPQIYFASPEHTFRWLTKPHKPSSSRCHPTKQPGSSVPRPPAHWKSKTLSTPPQTQIKS